MTDDANKPPTCILTGDPVEDPEDCTTHAHEGDEKRDGPLFRTFITAECFPKPDDTAERTIQLNTVLTHRMVELAVSMHSMIERQAPILMTNSPVGWLLVTLGHTLHGLETDQVAWMEAHEIAPLDLRAEEIRIAQHALDSEPEMDKGLRAQLEDIIATASGDPPVEWPDVIQPDGGQVN